MLETGKFAFDKVNSASVQILEKIEAWGYTSYRVFNPATGTVYKVTADQLKEDGGTNTYDENYLRYVTLLSKIKNETAGGLLSSLASGVIPLPHQLHVLNRAMESNTIRYILADEVGLGKTIEAGMVIKELKTRGLVKRVLVVCPTGLVTQWAAEMQEKFHERFNVILPSDYDTIRRLTDNDDVYGQYDQVISPMDSIKPIEKHAGWTDEKVEKYNEERIYSIINSGWDLVIIDEAHRTGANSYQKIMDYFKPKFWLGMTASPERTDDYDVFSAFDHNIALEIRLQQAMEEDLLCPFHYFGITDLEIDGEAIDEETGLRNFNRLVSDKRVDYIIEQMNFYGYSGDRVKGLVFCSSRKEAEALSSIFNDRGYKTTALTGADTQERREEMIELLTRNGTARELEEYGKNYLDYIFTVDVFNEGVDMPEVNQVIMLRPTQSPIVFVQQLGRGLRKSHDKDFVVILDFIGNYRNNFMIPIALSGDRTYNKDNIRRYVTEGEKVIPGISTIHFDEISRKRIYSAIDTANFSDIKLIKENYKNLKYKLGRIPSLMDFDRYGEMDVLRIFDNSSLGSYYKFLVKYEKEYKERLSSDEEKVIEFISKKLASGKRIHEIEMLARMLIYRNALLSGFQQEMMERYGRECSDIELRSVINVMTNEFPSGSGKKTYEKCVFMDKSSDGDYEVSAEFDKMINHKEFYDMVKELIEFGRYRYERDYQNNYKDTQFVLYQKYTYEDVCRLLNWEHNEVPLNIGGYKFDKETKTFPVFINYDKSDDIQDTIKYEDHFTSRSSLIAISKQSRTAQSEDVQNFLHAEERGISVELFVRKNKDDKISKEFYYLGHMKATGRTQEFIMNNTDKTAVEIEWELDTPVREDIYQYIVNE